MSDMAAKIDELEQARINDKAEAEAIVKQAKAENAEVVRTTRQDAADDVIRAKEYADERVRAAEAFMAETRDMVELLAPQINMAATRINTAATSIDVLTTATKKLAESADVKIVTPPKMNGGSGAMDPVPLKVVGASDGPR
jgi:lipopolysaccharide biosynthesis regulator YciM